MTEIWDNALSQIAAKVTQQNFEMWLSPIELCRTDGNTIVLRAPNPYVRLWFESNYLEIILDEIQKQTSTKYSVEFAPDQAPANAPRSEPLQHQATPDQGHASAQEHPSSEQSASRKDDRAREPAPSRKAPVSAADSARAKANTNKAESASERLDHDKVPQAPLNPRYTFDTFVAGPSNQLAYAAAQAAANTRPPKYNPIFICGGVGLGKTHLLHAIGNHFRAGDPTARILYLSGERFMNEYIQAIRTNQMHEFRRRYREGCDVLLVDDVQFLAGKNGTQDEFFHTFNALHDTHRQIVLTADRKPFEISDVADRLRTRFAWGLLADIEPPELEVRVAILRKKAAAENIDLPQDVALYIASSIKSNVRELEGALIRLAAFSSLSQRTIDLAYARETLEGSVTRPREHITAESVIKSVAHYYGLKISDIKSARRHKSVARPRAVAMYIARTHTNDSYPDLGRAFGGKHHTTVISAVDKITKRLEDDPGLRGEVHAIENVLLR